MNSSKLCIHKPTCCSEEEALILGGRCASLVEEAARLQGARVEVDVCGCGEVVCAILRGCEPRGSDGYSEAGRRAARALRAARLGVWEAQVAAAAFILSEYGLRVDEPGSIIDPSSLWAARLLTLVAGTGDPGLLLLSGTARRVAAVVKGLALSGVQPGAAGESRISTTTMLVKQLGWRLALPEPAALHYLVRPPEPLGDPEPAVYLDKSLSMSWECRGAPMGATRIEVGAAVAMMISYEYGSPVYPFDATVYDSMSAYELLSRGVPEPHGGTSLRAVVEHALACGRDSVVVVSDYEVPREEFDYAVSTLESSGLEYAMIDVKEYPPRVVASSK